MIWSESLNYEGSTSIISPEWIFLTKALIKGGCIVQPPFSSEVIQEDTTENTQHYQYRMWCSSLLHPMRTR
jgi:hypothetical protein